MNFDTERITSIDILTNDPSYNDESIKKEFIKFLEEYKRQDYFPYRTVHTDSLTINLDDLFNFNKTLSALVIKNPLQILSLFEQSLYQKFNKQIFISLNSSRNLISINSLGSKEINEIVRVKGIVVSTGTPFIKPLSLFLVCKNCLMTKMSDNLPRTCKQECGLDPYMVVPEKSKVVDCQYVKIQEENKVVNRHMTLFMQGKFVDKVKTGTVIEVTCIFMSSDTNTFIKVLGIENSIKQEEKKEINKNEKGLGNKFINSIAPSIFGYEDIKKVLACMLVGGVSKENSNTKTRGSINVLLLGDPGIAKSQFLKFVSKVSPIGVYTSGKGCSAAGLTASVLKDSHGFYLEAGAMVLSDGGVCCIDEFDKMNENDRVAIHEAMEQQTISVSKAGINTTLNCRSAVLAAANPIFGRYDEYKTPGENISFSNTILSRFDCIFILKDFFSLENDTLIANHILLNKINESNNQTDSEIMNDEEIKDFILKCKKIKPLFTKESSKKLTKYFSETRKKVRSMESLLKERTIPITVRQLEAIIRLSEALAKIEFKDEVSVSHVDEAIRLFNVSTLNAVSQGHYLEGMIRPEFMSVIDKITDKIYSFLPIGSAKPLYSVYKECKDFNEGMIGKCVDFLVKSGKIVLKENNKIVVRVP